MRAGAAILVAAALLLAGCGGNAAKTVTPTIQPVASGQRVSLASGLSVVLPDGSGGELARSQLSAQTSTIPVESLSFGEYAGPSTWRSLDVVSIRSRAECLALGTFEQRGTLGGGKRGGPVTVWWLPQTGGVAIVTRLSGRLTGVLFEMTGSAHSKRQAAHRAEAIWRAYVVHGATLPSMSGPAA